MFPTQSAKDIAISVKLYPRNKNTNMEKKHQMEQKLSDFQQISINCDLEQAMLIYHEHKLTDDQIKALELIHKITKPWAIGLISGELLKSVSGLSDKSRVSSTNSLIQSATLLIKTLVDEGQAQVGGESQKLIVKLTSSSSDESSGTNLDESV